MAAGAVATAVVSAVVAAAVVLTAGAEDKGQPLVGSLVGLGGDDDGSLYTQSFFW